MPFRTEFKTKTTIKGRPYTIQLVDNPTIDDVVVTEMKLRAAELMNRQEYQDHRVSRDVRDVLIRLGVER